MQPTLPEWALKSADVHDRQATLEARRLKVLQLTWKNDQAPRKWAKEHGWPTPWLSFTEAFLAKMLATDSDFALALFDSGVQITIPKSSYTIPQEELRELDEAYEERSWRWLVEALREIRRAVQAGVVVHVDGNTLKSFDSFYEWAHGRYHALEDDTGTGWIGDDSRQPY